MHFGWGLAQTVLLVLSLLEGVCHGGSPKEQILILLYEEKQDLSKLIHTRPEQWKKKKKKIIPNAKSSNGFNLEVMSTHTCCAPEDILTTSISTEMFTS